MGSRLSLALDEIQFARRYSLELLRNTVDADWFRMPSEGVTHLAWQAGHLAIVEYRLLLERTRGPRPSDAALIPSEYLGLFGKGSTPTGDPSAYPEPPAIRSVLDRVHEAALSELATLSDSDLDAETLGPPHPMLSTRHSALIWCARHELTHAGQIGLLRRLLGAAPLR